MKRKVEAVEAVDADASLQFEVLATDGRARATRVSLRHHECLTPMFMPVGTQGTVKGLTSRQLEELECQVILGNTYHLENRPGSTLLKEFGAGAYTRSHNRERDASACMRRHQASALALVHFSST